MKLPFLLFLLLAGVTWWIFNPRRAQMKSRVSLAVRVAVVGYLIIIGMRLSSSGFDEQDLTTMGLSIAFFAGLWGVAWLVTRFATGKQ